MLVRISILLAALLICAPVHADEADNETPKTPVTEWLRLGPVPLPLPAFSDEGNKPKAADLLDYAHMDRARMRPLEGDRMEIAGSKAISWRNVSGGASLQAGDTPAVTYLATYLQAPRWMKVDVDVAASHAFDLWVDGKSLVKRDGAGDDDKSGTATLTQGKHLILVKTVFVPADSAVDWTLDVEVGPAKGFEAVFSLSTSPRRVMSIHDVLDGPSVQSIAVSPDGSLFAISMQERRPPEGEADSWVEIRQSGNGALVRMFRDISGSSWQWSPTGHKLSYVTRDDDGVATLRVIDMDTGNIETVLEGVSDFSGYQWSPRGSFIAYSINKKPEEDKTGVQRLRGVSDRRAGERDRSSVYIASVPAGNSRRLTAGEHTVWVYDIHPDGKSLLIGRVYEDLTDRPYSRRELYVLDIETEALELLWKGSWLGSAEYSPDGKKILATGSPASFGEVGINVPDGAIPNDYDTQAFMFDIGSKEVDPITRDFNPTVYSAHWPKSSRDPFVVAEDGEFVRLFRYDARKREFKVIPVECDVIRTIDVAADKPVAVLTGSRANRPPRLHSVDLKSGHSRELLEPARERFKVVDIGDVADFDFTTSAGRKIAGRVHFPPGFDASKKWPCIVYYYGGTATVTRSFGGRYPKNLWAAHGYVVYVLQPSGATGFGQEFSARHVNDWGKIVSEEIIEGTGKFLEAHPFVDADRVGCIGASFGGFMTELLVTKTDMFAAAVSHAGISMISSYWGEGYWGYGYNSVSAANSFPWNRPDIYIDQSPLFGVENVSTPLLLLHGTSDHNVPPGESEQMYTALKLLGKEVEYIRVEGEDHWILDYKKRIVWSDAIISWFDRWLKDEPEWWDDMYPPLDEADASAADD